jgi:hypothetical protein
METKEPITMYIFEFDGRFLLTDSNGVDYCTADTLAEAKASAAEHVKDGYADEWCVA